ncbi:AAA family ATPase [Pacificimonas sp. ICDLI1SI03]
MTLHGKHIDWIEARGLDSELATKLGLTTVRDDGGNWISLPYVEYGNTVNHKRRLTSQKDHRMDGGAPLILWNHDVLLDEKVKSGEQEIIITEGEWDAIAAIQSGLIYTLSVPNGAPSKQSSDVMDETASRYQFLWRSRELLDKVGSIVLAVDGDPPGRALAADLARWFGPDRCKSIQYPEGTKDLNEVLEKHGAQEVRQIIADARPYPVKGLYTIDDFPEPPPVHGISYNVPALTEMLPVVRGTFTVGAGYAASGKTSLMVKIIASLLLSGETVALGSFETMIRPILVRKLIAAMVECAEFASWTERHSKAEQIIRDRLRIISQMPRDDDEDMDLDYVLDLARTAVLRDNCSVVILDPWNEIDHKRHKDQSETDYTGEAIRKMKRFAKNYNVAFWVIAHPAKPSMMGGKLPVPGLYSISGSAHWANKPDYGFIVNRPKPDTDQVDIHVTKVKMGLPGKAGKVTLTFDWHHNRYEECVDDFSHEDA